MEDEFRYYAPAARAGILLIRSLSGSDVLDAARDDTSAAHQRVLDEMGPSTNRSWISSQAAEEAYRRQLIDETELDRLTD